MLKTQRPSTSRTKTQTLSTTTQSNNINNANSPHATDDASREPGPLTPAAARLSPPPHLPARERASGRLFYVFYRQADAWRGVCACLCVCVCVVRAGGPSLLENDRDRVRLHARARHHHDARSSPRRPSASRSARAPRSTRSTAAPASHKAVLLHIVRRPTARAAARGHVLPRRARRDRPLLQLRLPPGAHRGDGGARLAGLSVGSRLRRMLHRRDGGLFATASVLLDANMRIDSH